MLIIIILIILIMFLFLDKTCDKQENFTKCTQKCCPHGWYGDKSPNCTKCPVNIPGSRSSENGITDANCTCPNSNIKSCFACNGCLRFDSDTGKCILKCPDCRTIKEKGVIKTSC